MTTLVSVTVTTSTSWTSSPRSGPSWSDAHIRPRVCQDGGPCRSGGCAPPITTPLTCAWPAGAAACASAPTRAGPSSCPAARRVRCWVRDELVFDGPARQPPGEAVDLVRAYVRDAPLQPVARLRTSRYPVELLDRAGQRLGELTDDRVAVVEGRQVTRRFREIEVELAEQAPDDALDGLLERLLAAGAEPVKVPSKYLQALGDRELLAPEVAVGQLGKGATVVELLRHDLSAAVL